MHNGLFKSSVTALLLAAAGMACTGGGAEDLSGPNIHILGVVEGNPLLVQGYITDQTGVESFTINSTYIPLNTSGEFIASIPNSPFYEVRAVDSLGQVTTETYARRDQKFVPTIAVRLNKSGLDFMTEELVHSVSVDSFEDQIANGENIMDTEMSPGFTIYAQVTSVAYSKPDVTLNLTETEDFIMDMGMPNLVTTTNMGGTIIWIPWSDTATVTADYVDFHTNAHMTIVNSLVDLGLSQTSLNFNNFYIDFGNISNFLGFEDFVNWIIEGLLGSFIDLFLGGIEDVAVPIMSHFIDDIPINGSVINSEGERINMVILPYNLGTDNGGTTIELKGTIAADTIAGVPGPFLGSIFTAGAAPVLTNKTKTNKDFDIGVMIGTNLINQAFLAGHESGQTTMEIDVSKNAGVSPAGVDVITQPSDDIIATDKMRFRVTPISPPYFTLKGNKNGKAWGVFGMKDFTLDYDVKRVGWGDWQNLYGATLDIEAEFTLGNQENGNLHVGLEKLPVVTFKSFHNTGFIQLSPTFLNSMVKFFMPLAMPTVGAALDSVPTPTIAGFGIKADEFWADGTGNTHLAMAGTMVKVEDTQAAPAPDTSVTLVSNEAADELITSENVTIQNGIVTLNFSGINPSTGSLEYRYRLDNSAIWSNWSTRTSVTVENLLGGAHVAEVCARTVLLKKDPTCAKANFVTQKL